MCHILLQFSVQFVRFYSVKEVLLRKFAADAQIDRTVNNLYIAEKRELQYCTESSRSFYLISVYRFPTVGFHSPSTCKSDTGFLLPGV